ncbi:unnamed protein product [Sphagnum jensenii]|uniref:Retrotransposon gag domain-containing protein n=1 Tax=Sphagnum jensenii TaxID=128206 RepID=A0ABP1A0L7_9BRYO
MSSSSNGEDSVELVNQESYELNLAHRFDVNTIQDEPRRGSVILHFVGFGVVRIVGINPSEARIGDVAVEVAHSGFYTRAQNFWKMTSPQGLDDLFWGRDHEDITDWTERLTMATEVRDLTPDKLFKIVKLNLRGRAKDWFRRLQPVPTNWTELRTLMIQNYGSIDADDIRMTFGCHQA